MTRTKPTKHPVATTLNSWGAVDTALKDIAELKRRIDEAEIEAGREMERIQQRLTDKAEPHRLTMQRLEEDIESFTRSHQHELEGRSRKLNFGAVFLRAVAFIPAPRGPAKQKIIESIKAHFAKKKQWEKFVKVEEKISIKAMGELSDDELAAVGLERKWEDSFSYDLFEAEDRSPVGGPGSGGAKEAA